MKSALLNVMTAAAVKAGKGLMRDFNEVDQLQVSRKGTTSFVTSADTRTEKMLFQTLRKARPDFGFLMEESGEVPGSDPTHRWVIDPLDGTVNFIHAIPYFCVSIGVERRLPGKPAEVVAGVIYDPIHNELFWAEKGQGAFMNDRRLAVSQRRTLDEAMLVTGHPRLSEELTRQALGMAERVAHSGAGIRQFGAAALDLANLAAGRIDGCWYLSLQAWDIAAGMLLVQEAGGTVSEVEGQAATLHSASLLTANPWLHPRMAALLDAKH